MTRQSFLLAGFAIVLTSVLALGSSSTKPPPNQSGAWNIGPVINGRNYSPGMPPSSPDGALTFPVGYPNSDHAVISSVHYVTRPLGLIGKTRVRMTFEIIGSGPFKSTELPDQLPPYVVLYFQRDGDNWSGTGAFESYRWWSNDFVTLAPGVHTLEVPLTRDAWVSVTTNQASPQDFAAAMANASAVGFTFGGAGGKGHGAYSETPGCQFILHRYEVL
jgi:hypothetical protein